MVLRRALITLLCFAQLATIFAKSPADSLATELDVLISQGSEDYEEISRRFEQLIFDYQASRSWGKAISKAEEAMYLSLRWEEPIYQFRFLFLLGQTQFLSQADDNLALNYLLQAEQLDPAEIDQKLKAKAYALMSQIYVRIGDINEALKIQLQAIDLCRLTQDTLMLTHGYQHLGSIYTGQGDYENALKANLMGLQLANSSAPSQAEARLELLSSTAAVYLKLREHEKANPYLKSLIQLADSLESAYGVARYEQHKGEALLMQGQIEPSYIYLRSADQYFEAQKLFTESAHTKLNIARLLIIDDQPSASLSLLDTIQNLSSQIPPAELKMQIAELRADGFRDLGRKDLAYDNLLDYLQLRDSIYGTPIRLDFARAESGITVSKFEEEIAEIKEAQQVARRQMIIGGMIAGFILLLVLLLMGYQRNRALNRVNKILAQKNEEIFMQNERLASSNEELRQFAHITSHDLREPLRSIGGFSTLLERKFKNKLDERGQEYLDFITSGVRRMDSLLADLMNYSVIGILEQKFEPVEIEKIISNIIETMHREKRAQGAKIKIRNLPVIIADVRQMGILFENLIDNAVKFRSEEIPQIEINCQKQDHHYLFSIKDNGIGMDEAYQEQIFSLFLRLHNNSSEYEGTGVGLSICRKIVQQHKGRIWINSQKGVGTTVYFLLPASPLEVTSPIKWRPER
ncbi:MAG: ATP-binding protein [Bacteroidota bacterium]